MNPYARHLGEGVRELRPTLDGAAMRITYWLAPGRRVVLLTVFRKTRMREDSEVKRALQAKKVCEAEHGPAHDEFVRSIEAGEVES
ncbi:type II toxin-antitoxin system RelE/ParE family toxin [Kribbella sandramycini]